MPRLIQWASASPWRCVVGVLFWQLIDARTSWSVHHVDVPHCLTVLQQDAMPGHLLGGDDCTTPTHQSPPSPPSASLHPPSPLLSPSSQPAPLSPCELASLELAESNDSTDSSSSSSSSSDSSSAQQKIGLQSARQPLRLSCVLVGYKRL